MKLKLSPQDIDALARIAQAEAGNQSSLGQQAVVFAVLNRAAAKTGGFPDTPIGVIEQRGQFEPMAGRSSYAELPQAKPETYDLVKQTLAAYSAGAISDPTNGSTFFQNPKITSQRGTNFATSAPAASIEDHAFYRRYRNNPEVEVPKYGIDFDGANAQNYEALLNESVSGQESGVLTNEQTYGQPLQRPSADYTVDDRDNRPSAGDALMMAGLMLMGEDAPPLPSGGRGLLNFQQGLEEARKGAPEPRVSSAPGQPSAGYAPSDIGSGPSAPLPLGVQDAVASSGQTQFGLKPTHDGVDLSGLAPETVQSAIMMASLLGQDLQVNSAYRSQTKQNKIRGGRDTPLVAKSSYHTKGSAIDNHVPSGTSEAELARRVDAAIQSGFTGIGWYPNKDGSGHLHYDRRNSVPNSFSAKRQWGGWTSLPPSVVEVMLKRGYRPGASADSIMRGSF